MKDDSIEGIYDTLKLCANISKSAGGIGLAVQKIRASGSYIAGVSEHMAGVSEHMAGVSEHMAGVSEHMAVFGGYAFRIASAIGHNNLQLSLIVHLIMT